MNVLFAGLGSIGQRHCRNLAALCREQGTALHITALRSTATPLSDEVLRCIDREIGEVDGGEYDIAFITGPTHLHADMLQRLKGRAKAFFIEKPLFHSADCTLEDAGLCGDVMAYVAAPLRFTGLYGALRSRLNAMAPFSVRAVSSSYLPAWRPGVDYRSVYSAHRDMGGGPALDLIHEWDYLVDLFGVPLKSAALHAKVSDLDIDADDLALYLARYDGFTAEVHLDYFGREVQRYLEALCAEGTLRADFAQNLLTLPDGSTEEYPENRNRCHERELAWFLRYVQGREEENLNPPERAMAVLRLALGETLL